MLAAGSATAVLDAMLVMAALLPDGGQAPTTFPHL
jgi:hypothetical protein